MAKEPHIPTVKPKVCVIDDASFMLDYARKFLAFCDVEQVNRLPEDPTALAKFDILIVDGEGIGNSQFYYGLDFCLAYEKQGNNKLVIYHSGNIPQRADAEALGKMGVAIIRKGSAPQNLIEAVRKAI